MLAGIVISNYSQFANLLLVSLGYQAEYLGMVLVVGAACAWLGNSFAPKLVGTHQLAEAVVPLCVASIGLVVGLNAVLFHWGATVVLYGLLRLLSSALGVVVDVKINDMATDTNRATLLSVTAMFDDFATIVCDPLIGIALDAFGFRYLYGLLGALLLAIVTGYLLLTGFLRRRAST